MLIDERQVEVPREARDDETDEADGRDGDRVGQLRGNVVQAVALRPGGRHDGGVGDGEQWSPHTAPAQQAEMPMMRSMLSVGKTAVTTGIRMPNVPHDVPDAKASTQATIKMTAGSRE